MSDDYYNRKSKRDSEVIASVCFLAMIALLVLAGAWHFINWIWGMVG